MKGIEAVKSNIQAAKAVSRVRGWGHDRLQAMCAATSQPTCAAAAFAVLLSYGCSRDQLALARDLPQLLRRLPDGHAAALVPGPGPCSAHAVASFPQVLRTSLGPKGMDKLLQGPDGDIVISACPAAACAWRGASMLLQAAALQPCRGPWPAHDPPAIFRAAALGRPLMRPPRSCYSPAANDGATILEQMEVENQVRWLISLWNPTSCFRHAGAKVQRSAVKLVEPKLLQASAWVQRGCHACQFCATEHSARHILAHLQCCLALCLLTGKLHVEPEQHKSHSVPILPPPCHHIDLFRLAALFHPADWQAAGGAEQEPGPRDRRRHHRSHGQCLRVH